MCCLLLALVVVSGCLDSSLGNFQPHEHRHGHVIGGSRKSSLNHVITVSPRNKESDTEYPVNSVVSNPMMVTPADTSHSTDLDDGDYYDTSTYDGGHTDAPQSNCTNCRLIREELRQMRINNIMKTILDKLGFKEPPNSTVVSRARREKLIKMPPIQRLLHSPAQERSRYQWENQHRDWFDGKEAFVLAEQYDLRGKTVHKFNFSQTFTNDLIKRAKLWLYIKGPVVGNAVAVNIYRVKPFENDPNTLTYFHNQFKKEPLRINSSSWIDVDIRKLVKEWFSHPSLNHGIIVEAVDEREMQVVVTDPSELGGDHVPFLELELKPSKRHRMKRNAKICEEASDVTVCCLYPLVIDFIKYGWDWIIAPLSYEANYCAGDCPFVYMQKYLHTVVANKINPQGTTGPCCAPSQMSGISMLYFDNFSNIVHEQLPNMVVDECSCPE